MEAESAIIIDDKALRFSKDFHARQRIFSPESFHHQARANLFLLAWLYRRYTQAGDVLLDPMAGTGSLMIAAQEGRSVHLVDLEAHWCEAMRASAEKIRVFNGFVPIDEITIHQADARRLGTCDEPFAWPINHIITSPPYWDMFSDWHIQSRGFQRENGPLGSAYADTRGVPSIEKKQIGNIHIYEVYLRAMTEVYARCFDLLPRGGRLIVILKDRIHKNRRIPICTDSATICKAVGFAELAHHLIDWPLSRYQRIHREKRPDAPAVDFEEVLVFERGYRQTIHLPPAAIVCKPAREYSPGAAPLKLFEKSIAHARSQGRQVFLMEDRYPSRSAFIDRRDFCFDYLRRTLVKHGLIKTGRCHFALYVPERYREYLERRLVTLGAAVGVPVPANLNMGQKLAWLKEREA